MDDDVVTANRSAAGPQAAESLPSWDHQYTTDRGNEHGCQAMTGDLKVQGPKGQTELGCIGVGYETREDVQRCGSSRNPAKSDDAKDRNNEFTIVIRLSPTNDHSDNVHVRRIEDGDKDRTAGLGDVCTDVGQEKKLVSNSCVPSLPDERKLAIDEQLPKTSETKKRVSKSQAVITMGTSGKRRYVYGPVKCTVCGKTLSHRGSLQTHMLTHTKEKPFTCPTCGRSFSINANYKAHLLTHQPPQFTCNSCKHKFVTKRQLEKHVKQHENKKQFGKQKPRDAKKGPQICDMCGKTIRSYSDLQVHLRAHTGEKAYTCETCGQGFNVRCNYKRHGLRHSDHQPHKCHTCPKAFYEKRHLKAHMENIHGSNISGETVQSYRCDHCPERFPTLKILATHQKVRHSVCQVCHTEFDTSSELKQHSLTHAQHKTFVCMVCNKAHKSHRSLRSHEVIHDDRPRFKCSVENCQSTFWQSQSLSRHIKYHSDTKTHVCDICLKAFPVKQDLVRHKTIHSGKKLMRHDQAPAVSEVASCQQPSELSWLCMECQVLFKTKEQLLEHQAAGCQPSTVKYVILDAPSNQLPATPGGQVVDGVALPEEVVRVMEIDSDVLLQIRSLCQPGEQIVLVHEAPVGVSQQVIHPGVQSSL